MTYLTQLINVIASLSPSESEANQLLSDVK